MTRVRKVSAISGQVNEMDLPCTLADIEAWRNGGKCIQDALPQLSADQREFLLTGTTPEEWKSLNLPEDD